MKNWRLWCLFVFLLLPLAVLFGVGAWSLWHSDRLAWVAVFTAVCWSLAFCAYRWWGIQQLGLTDVTSEIPAHWTPRDREAMRIVDRKIDAIRATFNDEIVRH